MSTLGIAVVIAAVGIDVGWRPLEDGRFEYILQLEPSVLEALRAGREVASDIPDGARGARCYRLTVGTATLPRSDTPPAPADAAPTGAFDITTLKAPAEQFGWQALEGGGFECILQLDPQRLDALAAGEDIQGELPAFLHDVRTYRITLGTQSLPRTPIGGEAKTPSPDDPRTAAPQPVSDSLIREASAEVPPALPSAATDAAKGNSPPPQQDVVAQTAGYAQAGVLNAAGAPDDSGSPSSVSPPLSELIPQRLSWREPYTLALIGLFTSVGMNLYLGWVTWNANHRYRVLRQQVVGDHVAAE